MIDLKEILNISEKDYAVMNAITISSRNRSSRKPWQFKKFHERN